MKELSVSQASKLYRKSQTTIKAWLGNWEQNNLGVSNLFKYNELGRPLINPDKLDEWLVKYRNKEDLA